MLLKLGSKGDDVKKLQTKLGLNADGDFGPATDKAVKSWQSKNGLTADGIVGDKTWAKMFEVITKVEQPIKEVVGLNIHKLKGVIPDEVILQIPDTAKKFNITTNLRLAHFLSQCSHESGGFKSIRENLNYSEELLLKTFKSDFDVNKDKVISEIESRRAKLIARKPEEIGNFVYANQNGNGNEASGDGWNFRGRGYIQLTGRSNYKKFSDFIGEDCISNPDLVATKYPLASAAFFFNNNKLWDICDGGSDEEDVKKLTKRVNGGLNGIEDRQKKFKVYFNLLK